MRSAGSGAGACSADASWPRVASVDSGACSATTRSSNRPWSADAATVVSGAMSAHMEANGSRSPVRSNEPPWRWKWSATLASASRMRRSTKASAEPSMRRWRAPSSPTAVQASRTAPRSKASTSPTSVSSARTGVGRRSSNVAPPGSRRSAVVGGPSSTVTRAGRGAGDNEGWTGRPLWSGVGSAGKVADMAASWSGTATERSPQVLSSVVDRAIADLNVTTRLDGLFPTAPRRKPGPYPQRTDVRP
jgi:hypothetical protein